MPAHHAKRARSEPRRKRSTDELLLASATIGLAACAVAGFLTWLVLFVLAFEGGWGLLPSAALPLAVAVLACAALTWAVNRKLALQAGLVTAADSGPERGRSDLER